MLNNESPTETIEGIKLTMPNEVAEKADVIGLSVTDGSMMWPIRQKQNLRDYLTQRRKGAKAQSFHGEALCALATLREAVF